MIPFIGSAVLQNVLEVEHCERAQGVEEDSNHDSQKQREELGKVDVVERLI